MLVKTHLAFVILIMFLFLPHIQNKVVFSIAILVATLIPDIDSGFSTMGRNIFGKILGFFVRHRGFIHSLTFGVILTVIITFFLPVAALGFFLGYSFHLFLDSFTVEGILPFWPLRKKSFWKIRTGGKIEAMMFLFFAVIDFSVLGLLILF